MNEPDWPSPQGTVELTAPIVDLEPLVKVLKEIRNALHDLERTVRTPGSRMMR